MVKKWFEPVNRYNFGGKGETYSADGKSFYEITRVGTGVIDYITYEIPKDAKIVKSTVPGIDTDQFVEMLNKSKLRNVTAAIRPDLGA